MQSCGSMPMDEDGEAIQPLPEEDEEQAEALSSTSNPSPPDVKCTLVEGRQQGICSPTRAFPTRRARSYAKGPASVRSVPAGVPEHRGGTARGHLRSITRRAARAKRSPRVRRAGRPSSMLRSARSMEHGSSCLVGRARACGQGVRTRRMDAGRTHVLQRMADDSRALHHI
ncbi:hypothetical protein T492DRAFT_980711 [Pavlovales sp. CCMP2436]|nr:hypothetical protein T492DRAFT_980711 [Pavlovales sp. CCMP2436]